MKIVTLGIGFGILAALFIGNVKARGIDNHANRHALQSGGV